MPNWGPVTPRTRDPEQVRGITLYALTAVLAVAGAAWFLASAPRTGEDPRTVAGRQALARLVPDVPGQIQAETVVVATGSTVERNVPAPGGSYVLVVACAGAGEDRVRVRLSSTTVDSGRVVPCVEDPPLVELNTALGSMFFMSVTSEAAGETVFRWRLVRAGTL
ncbi:DUF6023 family protein [Actinoplanes sp. RD1]|uniref:DUF6023 family protein n=1 Tax=Actinoplanes sp. RD1 TaxID=3064538 RepID=UPI0027413B72|nr:DUF6023 family protein [Actinoplanes sp. RD1]